MNKPRLHGLDSDFQLDENTCNSLKVDQFLSSLPAESWSVVEDLVKAFIKCHGNSVTDPKKAFSRICTSLDTISTKRRKHLALHSYCNDVLRFLKQKHIQTNFSNLYNSKIEDMQQEQLESQAHKAGYKNGIRLAIIGSKKYANMLEQQIDEDENEDAQSTNSSDTHTTDLPKRTSILGKRERDEFYSESDNDNDGNSGKVSVGTAIKRDALSKHESYKQGVKLSTAERKNMSSGLSSMLDLIDLSKEGQASLFGEAEWDNIKSRLMKKYTATPYVLPHKVTEAWKIIAALAKHDNGFDSSRRYLSKLEESSTFKPFVKFSRVFKVCIDILEMHPMLFKKKFSDRITEYDYLQKVWGPLLEAILAVNGGIIRLKSGESVNDTTTQNKTEIYSESRSIGFKIDLRFIYDTDEDEYDVGAGEAARDNNDEKLIHDLGKVVREGKDVLDGLLHIVMNDKVAKDLSAWVIQISALQGEVASIHLAGDGLYAAVPQGKLRFPRNLSNMEDFIPTVSNLFLFVTNLETSAHEIKAAVDLLENRRTSMGLTFNRSRSPIEGHCKSKWMRPTWYSPPHQNQYQSVLPNNLHGENIYSRYYSEEDRDVSPVPTDATEADEFGWIKVKDAWYNIFTKTHSENHPYE